jgi:hypothetical protein
MWFMKKLILLCILVITGVVVVKAQEEIFTAPDYSQIEKNISDTNSEYYYPNLLKLVEAVDTSLNNEHYRHLYYGQIFQDSYSPYASDSDDRLLPYYQLKTMNEKEQDEFIVLATEALIKNPVDLRVMNSLVYTYHLKGNEEMSAKLRHRFFMTLSAMLSSGNGETCASGYHVVYVSHEYVFMNLFGFELEMQSVGNEKGYNCDYMQFAKNRQNVEGIYFNIDKPYGTLMNLHE